MKLFSLSLIVPSLMLAGANSFGDESYVVNRKKPSQQQRPQQPQQNGDYGYSNNGGGYAYGGGGGGYNYSPGGGAVIITRRFNPYQQFFCGRCPPVAPIPFPIQPLRGVPFNSGFYGGAGGGFYGGGVQQVDPNMMPPPSSYGPGSGYGGDAGYYGGNAGMPPGPGGLEGNYGGNPGYYGGDPQMDPRQGGGYSNNNSGYNNYPNAGYGNNPNYNNQQQPSGSGRRPGLPSRGGEIQGSALTSGCTIDQDNKGGLSVVSPLYGPLYSDKVTFTHTSAQVRANVEAMKTYYTENRDVGNLCSSVSVLAPAEKITNI